jgi:hypothetical protein
VEQGPAKAAGLGAAGSNKPPPWREQRPIPVRDIIDFDEVRRLLDLGKQHVAERRDVIRAALAA